LVHKCCTTHLKYTLIYIRYFFLKSISVCRNLFCNNPMNTSTTFLIGGAMDGTPCGSGKVIITRTYILAILLSTNRVWVNKDVSKRSLSV
jgi:hypothetical protein